MTYIHDLKLETDDDCEPKKPPTSLYRLLHSVLAARADDERTIRFVVVLDALHFARFTLREYE